MGAYAECLANAGVQPPHDLRDGGPGEGAAKAAAQARRCATACTEWSQCTPRGIQIVNGLWLSFGTQDPCMVFAQAALEENVIS